MDTATGDVRWSFPVKGAARPLGVAQGVVYVPADAEHRVYALDAANGTELWHFDIDSGNDCCIAVAKGAVYVGTFLGGVYAIEGDGSTAGT
jgi:outer membrane protein assembly factor BamB